MKRLGFFLALLLPLLLNNSASAQSTAPLFNWTGFYAGVNGGWQSYGASGHFPASAVPPGSFETRNKSETIGGFHGGYQVVWGNWLIGLEGAWDAQLSDGYARKDGSNIDNVGCGANPIVFCEARVSNILSVGPRLGYVEGPWLFYGTGGYAQGHFYADLTTTEPKMSGQSGGWYAGGGIEVFLAQHLTFGVEYRHYAFDGFNVVGLFTGAGGHILTPISDIQVKDDALFLRLTVK